VSFDETAASFLNRCPIQLTEQPAEADEIFIVELLAAKENNQMVEPGAVNQLEVVRTDVLQIQALNFSPKCVAGWNDRHSGGHEAHAKTLTEVRVPSKAPR